MTRLTGVGTQVPSRLRVSSSTVLGLPSRASAPADRSWKTSIAMVETSLPFVPGCGIFWSGLRGPCSGWCPRPRRADVADRPQAADRARHARPSAGAVSAWMHGGARGWLPGAGGLVVTGEGAAAQQGAADERADPEDADGPPEPDRVAVYHGQLDERGAGVPADHGGRVQVGGQVAGGGAGRHRVQQGGADGAAELLADVDGRGGDARVRLGHA